MAELGSGGVVYSIMLRSLFNRVGFEWAVRISALMTGVLCVVGILTVRRRRPTNKRTRGLLLEARVIKDRRFLLLAAGSFFVCLGVPASPALPASATDHPLRHLHALLLHCRLHGIAPRLVESRVHGPLDHERGGRLWAHRTRLVVRQDRPVQSAVPFCVFGGTRVPRRVAGRQGPGDDHRVRRGVWALFGCVHLGGDPVRRADIRGAGDGDAYWGAVHLGFGTVRVIMCALSRMSQVELTCVPVAGRCLGGRSQGRWCNANMGCTPPVSHLRARA